MTQISICWMRIHFSACRVPKQTRMAHFPRSDKNVKVTGREQNDTSVCSVCSVHSDSFRSALLHVCELCFLKHTWGQRWIMGRRRLCLSLMGIQPLLRWSTLQHPAPLQGCSLGCKSVSRAVMVHNGVTETSPLPRTLQFCSCAAEHLFQINLKQHKKGILSWMQQYLCCSQKINNLLSYYKSSFICAINPHRKQS